MSSCLVVVVLVCNKVGKNAKKKETQSVCWRKWWNVLKTEQDARVFCWENTFNKGIYCRVASSEFIDGGGYDWCLLFFFGFFFFFVFVIFWFARRQQLLWRFICWNVGTCGFINQMVRCRKCWVLVGVLANLSAWFALIKKRIYRQHLFSVSFILVLNVWGYLFDKNINDTIAAQEKIPTKTTFSKIYRFSFLEEMFTNKTSFFKKSLWL